MSNKPTYLLFAAVVGLAGGLFVFDLLLPLRVSVYLPYVVVVMLSLWFPHRWQTYATTVACTVLIFLGLFLSPHGVGPFWMSAMNRGLGMGAAWITAVIGLAVRRTAHLEQANKRLQQEIHERERLQAQLVRTQRLESVGILASGMAHDFNNLLTPILMSVKLLKEARSEDERQLLLNTLRASAERGAEMVRQLLAFAGGAGGQREIVNARQVIMEIKAILEHTLPKTIEITTELADDLKLVHADSTQLSQVLMNLCINARDAMPGGGKLAIQADNVQFDQTEERIHPNEKPGQYVQVSVVDQGTGIPPEILDKVFDPFFTTKGPEMGTGLGLSSALGIVKGHGGFITVKSDLGSGSHFTVYIPAFSGWTESQSKQDCQTASRGRGELILVVDDEPLILYSARATLEGQGYQVITASHGIEALELFKNHAGEIQAVLLDMMMPGMDGQATMMALEVLKRDVRVIASSGLQVTGHVAEAIVGGRGALLPKPYSDEQLLATLAGILNKNQDAQ